jgi:hypothetical protein
MLCQRYLLYVENLRKEENRAIEVIRLFDRYRGHSFSE